MNNVTKVPFQTMGEDTSWVVYLLTGLSSVLVLLLLAGLCYVAKLKYKKQKRRLRRSPYGSSRARDGFSDVWLTGERGIGNPSLDRRQIDDALRRYSMHDHTSQMTVIPRVQSSNVLRSAVHRGSVDSLAPARQDSETRSRRIGGSGGDAGNVKSTGGRPVVNPVFTGDDESGLIPAHLLEGLYTPSERSSTRQVCGKQVVSVCHEVGPEGDLLILDNMGISLLVPPGAVNDGDRKLIALLLNWDLSDNPHMDTSESLVSPVVYVGPHNLDLARPCILKFKHCAFDIRQVKVMRSETEIDGVKEWQEMCDSDGRTDKCCLTADECQLVIDTFTLYTCIQAPLEDNPGRKWLQIAVFASPLKKNTDHHQVSEETGSSVLPSDKVPLN